jgi:PAS domain S-box-containing protein
MDSLHLRESSYALLGMAYMLLPLSLAYGAWRQQRRELPRIFWLFLAFVFCCGLTHFLEVAALAAPPSRVWDLFQLGAATLALGTALTLIPFMPRILALRHPEPLEQEILRRREAELALQQANAAMEQRVQERTWDLTQVNEQLQREITDRSRIEAELRKAMQFQEKLLELTSNAIAVLDREGRLSHLNRRALELTGYCREELEGHSFAEIVPAEQLADTSAAVQRTLVDGAKVYQVETDILRRDGGRRTISFNLAPMIEDGKVVGAVGTAEDITDALRAQHALERYAHELERSNRELVQFAYVASHDLQEPLRVVAGYLQLLETQQGDTLKPEGRRYIERAVGAVKRMHGLINDLLAYSRIGSRGTIRTHTLVHQVLEKVRENVAVTLTETGANLHIDTMPAVWADASQLTQVFQNLLSNALKFRGTQPPEIHIAAEREEDGWRFGVRDNGIGLAAEHAERVFQIFQRLHTRSEFPGNGIGLAICKKIVEGHGGRIWVESQPGQGALFQFTIPDAPGGSKP